MVRVSLALKGALVAVIAILVGYSFWYYKKPLILAKPASMPTMTAANPLAQEAKLTEVIAQPKLAANLNWKMYNSKKYGFQVSYPSEIYDVKDEVYPPMVTFSARTKELKMAYGDIQVYIDSTEGSFESEESGAFDEQSFKAHLRTRRIGANDVYYDDSQEKQECGFGEGYCPVSGMATIFPKNRKIFLDIRRITFDGSQVFVFEKTNDVYEKFLESLRVF